ncbi:MAG: hypothetical protein JW912_01375 [Sedimentisphaerales bacterium]|nr:hypothetical protein [Sedimentisphaerales bacterium]
MKKQLLSFLTICIMSTFVISVQNLIAQEEETDKETITAEDKAAIEAKRAEVQKMIEQRRKTRKMQQPMTPETKMGLDRKRLKLMDQQIEQRKQEHKDFVEELKAAKEMALKEKATKTAEKLEQIIKKQELRFDRTMGNYQKSRNQVREQFQQENLPDIPEEPTEESAEQPKEKKTKWWKFWK